MENSKELVDLDADLDGQKVEIVRERTNVLLSAELKVKIKTIYPNRSLGSILEEGAMLKLRSEGHLPSKQKGVEPADMKSYVASKVEKVALDEIKDRVSKVNTNKRDQK